MPRDGYVPNLVSVCVPTAKSAKLSLKTELSMSLFRPCEENVFFLMFSLKVE